MFANASLEMLSAPLVMGNIKLPLMHAESSSTTIPPDVLPPQADVATANLPPRAQADIEEEADRVIESIEDSHEEEEHIL